MLSLRSERVQNDCAVTAPATKLVSRFPIHLLLFAGGRVASRGLVMRALLIGAFALLFATATFAKPVHVNGYYKSDGTYVAPYVRSSPDNSLLNNYSTKGNV